MHFSLLTYITLTNILKMIHSSSVKSSSADITKKFFVIEKKIGKLESQTKKIKKKVDEKFKSDTLYYKKYANAFNNY